MSAPESPVPGSLPVLARAPQALLWLRRLARRPLRRALGNHSGRRARSLGFADDEVMLPDGRRVTAGEAKAVLGPEWYLSAQFTGRERITEAGRRELAKLKTRA